MDAMLCARNLLVIRGVGMGFHDDDDEACIPMKYELADRHVGEYIEGRGLT